MVVTGAVTGTVFLAPTTAVTNAGAFGDTDESQPAFEARLDFVIGPLAGAFFGGMYEYEEVWTPQGTGVGEKAYDIDSNVIGFAAKAGFGPLTFMADIFQDTNNYNGGYTGPEYVAALDGIIDYVTTGWQVAATYNITPMFTASARYGQHEIEADNTTLATGNIEDEQTSFGINLDMMIIPGTMGATVAYTQQDEEDVITAVGAAPTPQGDASAIKFEWWIAF
jgi:hypothetical protein